MAVMVSVWARLASSGTTPPNDDVQVDLARHHRRADLEVLVHHGRRRLVARRLDRQEQPARARTGLARSHPRQSGGDLARRYRTFAFDRRGRPGHVDQRRGHFGQGPAVDDHVDRRPEAATGHVLCRARCRRAVRIGARHDQHPGLRQQRAEKPVVGDAHGHLLPPRQPFGRVDPGSKAKARVRGPGHQRPASSLATGP